MAPHRSWRLGDVHAANLGLFGAGLHAAPARDTSLAYEETLGVTDVKQHPVSSGITQNILKLWYITMLLSYYMPYWIMYGKLHWPECVSFYIQPY